VRAVILTGEGPSFCAGLDVKSVLGRPGVRLIALAALCSPVRNRFQDWSLGWRDVPAPVIAVIHGNCFGAGLQLALGADIRIATPDAQISVMEAKWGLVPDMGGTVLLRELVPIDVAKELTMTGRMLTGVEARARADHVSPEPVAHAEAWRRVPPARRTPWRRQSSCCRRYGAAVCTGRSPPSASGSVA
jgi:enoyl-CoA hydratase/carnithine racemase